MEVITDTPYLAAELLEEAKFFKNTGDSVITHRHIEGEGFSDEITIDGKVYSFTENRAYSGGTEYKRYLKRYAKLALYRAMSDYFGQKLPWGALTGIRPVKFAYQEGDNWREEMREVFGVSDQKLDIVGRVRERR
ncbi:MAG: hypothetical protein IJS67_02675, partial [Clostridia bacterium]|nr:hypothetical protein [Clostridia bacterium]